MKDKTKIGFKAKEAEFRPNEDQIEPVLPELDPGFVKLMEKGGAGVSNALYDAQLARLLASEEYSYERRSIAEKMIIVKQKAVITCLEKELEDIDTFICNLTESESAKKSEESDDSDKPKFLATLFGSKDKKGSESYVEYKKD
jgi:hypothetical protein